MCRGAGGEDSSSRESNRCPCLRRRLKGARPVAAAGTGYVGGHGGAEGARSWRWGWRWPTRHPSWRRRREGRDRRRPAAVAGLGRNPSFSIAGSASPVQDERARGRANCFPRGDRGGGIFPAKCANNNGNKLYPFIFK